jgi:hypothetical protein
VQIYTNAARWITAQCVDLHERRGAESTSSHVHPAGRAAAARAAWAPVVATAGPRGPRVPAMLDRRKFVQIYTNDEHEA